MPPLDRFDDWARTYTSTRSATSRKSTCCICHRMTCVMTISEVAEKFQDYNAEDLAHQM
eukprot:jgi/Bigna1/61926/fgenesh1_kg.28_\